jgi:hypothetical protein
MVADAGPIPELGVCLLPLLGERTLFGMALMVLYSRLLSARSFIITCRYTQLRSLSVNVSICCSDRLSQAGLDYVPRVREKFPHCGWIVNSSALFFLQ